MKFVLFILCILLSTIAFAGADSEKLKLEIEKLKLQVELEKAKSLNSSKSSDENNNGKKQFLEKPNQGMTWDQYVENQRDYQDQFLSNDEYNLPSGTIEKYKVLIKANPNVPSYMYLLARVTDDYKLAEKCTEKFPKYKYCMRVLATNDMEPNFQRLKSYAKKWLELDPDSKNALDRNEELKKYDGCRIKFIFEPVPTSGTSSSYFSFYTKVVNDSKFFNIYYIAFDTTIEWMGNTYTGSHNSYMPSAGTSDGHDLFLINVDEQHPANKNARPTIKSIKLKNKVNVRDQQTVKVFRLNEFGCPVQIFIGNKEWK